MRLALAVLLLSGCASIEAGMERLEARFPSPPWMDCEWARIWDWHQAAIGRLHAPLARVRCEPEDPTAFAGARRR